MVRTDPEESRKNIERTLDFELNKSCPPPPLGVLQTYPILKKITSRIF